MFTISFGDYSFPNQTFEIAEFPLENKIQENDIPRRHGSVIQAPYLGSRKIRIKGTLHSSSSTTTQTQLMAMQAALLAGEKALQYRSDRYINCRLKNLKPSYPQGLDMAVIAIDISLIAGVPFFYSAGASYSDTQTPSAGVTISFGIGNGGNVFSEPIFSICATGGTISDNIWLKNVTNSKILQFRGTVPNGATIVIDTDLLTVLNNGADGLSNFEGDFITLEAGTNTMQFVGAACRVKTEYKYRWY